MVPCRKLMRKEPSHSAGRGEGESEREQKIKKEREGESKEGGGELVFGGSSVVKLAFCSPRIQDSILYQFRLLLGLLCWVSFV